MIRKAEPDLRKSEQREQGLARDIVLSVFVFVVDEFGTAVLAGVVFAMAVQGLVATWIPAQRALSVDPLVLLREE